MPSRPSNLLRHPWRGVAALALLAVVPKCVVCAAAYFGLGALLGLGGPELCGAPTGPSFAGTTVFAACGLAGALGAAGWRWACRRKRPGLRTED